MKICADTLYDIYKTTKEEKAPDLVIGLAMLRDKRPGIGQEEDQALREFIGRHGKVLAKAFPQGRDAFREVAETCIREDEEQEKKAAEAGKE